MSDENPVNESLRLDKWLWQARFFKSRSRAARICAEGRLRLNGAPIRKAHHAVRPGDVLTFPQSAGPRSAGPRSAGRGARRAPVIRVVRVVALGARRGPATEARTLYEDLTPPKTPESTPESAPAPASRGRGAGRPTKAERRAIGRLTGRD